MQTLEVRRDELEATRLVEEDDPQAAEGEAVLAIERFGLTANNVTYGFAGDLLGYWRFFPTGDEGWGRVPAWGLANVTESRSDAVAVGDRFYGYLPMSTHTVIQPKAAGTARIMDAAAHRAELPPIYSTYDVAPSERENETVILRPLFFTALVLDAAMAAHNAEQIIVSSASARTASAFSFFAARREAKLVGLTSAERLDWVRGLGVYDEVLSYDELESVERRPSVYVDISGDAEHPGQGARGAERPADPFGQRRRHTPGPGRLLGARRPAGAEAGVVLRAGAHAGRRSGPGMGRVLRLGRRVARIRRKRRPRGRGGRLEGRPRQPRAAERGLRDRDWVYITQILVRRTRHEGRVGRFDGFRGPGPDQRRRCSQTIEPR